MEIKFLLNKNKVKGYPSELNCEYTAFIDENNPDIVLVTWNINGEMCESEYPCIDVEYYFHNGDWIEIY